MSNKQIDELSFASTISDATSIPVNNNSAIYEAEQLTVGTLGNFLGARANAIHNLGDVYTNKSSLATDNPGAMPAWTGEYVINATDVYPDLYTWVKVSHPELCVTRAAYDAAISSTGECKYFVVDEVTGSLRFPKYNYTAPDYPWIYCFNAAVPQTTTQGAEYTAALVGKVSKSGDTMTGNLTIGNSNRLHITNSNDAGQSLYADNSGSLIVSDNTGKGIVLYHDDNNKPWYIGQNGWQPMPWTTNVGEFSTNITNVITSIPQDFSITLNSGNLTLGTNATVYYPNGTNTFGTYTTASSITLPKNSSAKYFVYLRSNSTADTMNINYCFAGTTAPTVTTTYALWYDLTTNKIKYTNDNGSTWTEGCSFPIAVIYNNTPGTVNADGIESVFVGCGYIADVIFRLPGLAGVLPNGLNKNGLGNLLCTSDSVYINQLTGTGPVVLHMGYGSAHDSTYFVKSENEPSSNYTLWYKPSENKMYRKNGDGTISNCQEVIYAEAERTNGRVSNWQPRTVYRLPDNDKQYNVGKDIGEVFFTYDGTTNRKTPAGGLPLFTGSVISNASGTYPDFWNWLTGNNDRMTSLTTTEVNYQQSITDYGVCPFFVVDTVNDTIRLPLLKVGGRELVKSYKNGTDWYNIYSDGWCEQGGRYYNNASVANTINLHKSFIDTNYSVLVDRGVNGTYNNNINGQHAGEPYDFTTASFKVNTYASTGLNTIQWRAYGYVSDAEISGFPQKNFKWPWICAYNSAIPVGVAQVEQFQQALDGKVDKANLVDADVVVETYVNGPDWYRVWSDGWCEQGGYSLPGTLITFLKPYRDAHINFQVTPYGGTNASSASPCSTYNVTSTGFYFTTASNAYPAHWRVSGYIS